MKGPAAPPGPACSLGCPGPSAPRPGQIPGEQRALPAAGKSPYMERMGDVTELSRAQGKPHSAGVLGPSPPLS